MDFSDTIAASDLKVGRCRKLIEFMKVCEYGRPRSFLYHIFSRFRCFVLYKATISGEHLQDHWSSGFYSFRLNHWVTGPEPFYFHIVNVFLHAGVTYLFGYVCHHVFRQSRPASLLAGLLFAVHPIHTEAVSLV